jgi:hypothetical protein
MHGYKIYATMIYMFDDDFFNLLHPLRNNLWPAHPTNWKYKTWLLKQSDYLLGFVFPNKYYFKIIINKKWLKNKRDFEEDEYESPTFVYYKETNVMVPLVRVGMYTPPRMQGACSNNDTKMSKAMVESCRGVDDN